MEEVGATHHLGGNSCPIVSAAQLSLPEGGRPQHLRLSEVAKEVSSFSGYSDPMLGFKHISTEDTSPLQRTNTVVYEAISEGSTTMPLQLLSVTAYSRQEI